MPFLLPLLQPMAKGRCPHQKGVPQDCPLVHEPKSLGGSRPTGKRRVRAYCSWRREEAAPKVSDWAAQLQPTGPRGQRTAGPSVRHRRLGQKEEEAAGKAEDNGREKRERLKRKLSGTHKKQLPCSFKPLKGRKLLASHHLAFPIFIHFLKQTGTALQRIEPWQT